MPTKVGLPPGPHKWGEETRTLPRHVCLAPEPCWKRYEPPVSDIRLWSKSILGHLGALRSVLEGVLPRQRALPNLHSKGGKTRAERHGVTDEANLGAKSILAPRNCRPKDFGPLNLAGQRVTA